MRPIIVTAALGAGALSVYLIALAAVGLGARARSAQLIVVPGNLVGSDGRPSPRLRARLDAALAAWRSGLAPRILVSGGVEPGGRNEAAAMARYLTARGPSGLPRAGHLRDGSPRRHLAGRAWLRAGGHAVVPHSARHARHAALRAGAGLRDLAALRGGTGRLLIPAGGCGPALLRLQAYGRDRRRTRSSATKIRASSRLVTAAAGAARMLVM